MKTVSITHKDWSKIPIIEQGFLCKNYQVILLEYAQSNKLKWNKRYNTFKKYVNQENFDKGMKIFNDGVQDFSKQMDDMTKGLGGDPKNNKKNVDMLWGGSKNEFNLFSKPKPTASKKKGKKKKKKDDEPSNMDKIWGKKDV